MQHQRKFLSPASAVSAARCAAFPIGVQIAAIEPIRTPDGFLAVLKLYDRPEWLSDEARTRLAPFQIEHVERPKPKVEDEDEDEDEDDDDENPILQPDGRVVRGQLRITVRKYLLANPDSTNSELYNHCEALGLKRGSVQGVVSIVRHQLGSPSPPKGDKRTQLNQVRAIYEKNPLAHSSDVIDQAFALGIRPRTASSYLSQLRREKISLHCFREGQTRLLGRPQGVADSALADDGVNPLSDHLLRFARLVPRGRERDFREAAKPDVTALPPDERPQNPGLAPALGHLQHQPGNASDLEVGVASATRMG
jgi:hypothetical protein